MNLSPPVTPRDIKNHSHKYRNFPIGLFWTG
jgi:hypothetical protein